MARTFFPIDATLAPRQIFLFGLQHVLSMFVGIVTPALVVSGALRLSVEVTASLVSAALLASGIGTLVQVHGLGPFGCRMLSVQGSSFIFVPLAIEAGKVGGLPLIFGGVGMTDLAGGHGSPELGSLRNLALGGVVLGGILALGSVGGGRFASVSIALGLALGYALALALGMIDLTAVGEASWLRLTAALANSTHPILHSLGVLAESGVAVGTVTAIVLNALLPHDEEPAPDVPLAESIGDSI